MKKILQVFTFVFLVSSPTPSQSYENCMTPEGFDILRRILLNEINIVRQSHGLHLFVPNYQLDAAAQEYSCINAARDTISHRGPDGSTPGQRVQRFGYYFIFMGENLGIGYKTPRDATQGWMDSPPHRQMMLSRQPVDIGLGIATNASRKLFWTMKVARRMF